MEGFGRVRWKLKRPSVGFMRIRIEPVRVTMTPRRNPFSRCLGGAGPYLTSGPGLSAIVLPCAYPVLNGTGKPLGRN